jgi:hypothetical protein
MSILFDKLRYKDRLTGAGIADDHARAHAEAIEEALRDSVATQGFVRQELLALEYRLTTRVGLMAVSIVVILASIKYFG